MSARAQLHDMGSVMATYGLSGRLGLVFESVFESVFVRTQLRLRNIRLLLRSLVLVGVLLLVVLLLFRRPCTSGKRGPMVRTRSRLSISTSIAGVGIART